MNDDSNDRTDRERAAQERFANAHNLLPEAEAMRLRCEAIVRAEYSRGETVALTRILKAIVALKNG